MGFINRLRNFDVIKFSFGKADEYLEKFSKSINAFSMFDEGYGLGIPNYLSSGNQLMQIFIEIYKQNGVFVFNINGVDLRKAYLGFENGYEEAASCDNITEWELSIILRNDDYFDKTIFHNGKMELIKEQNGLRILWN